MVSEEGAEHDAHEDPEEDHEKAVDLVQGRVVEAEIVEEPAHVDERRRDLGEKKAAKVILAHSPRLRWRPTALSASEASQKVKVVKMKMETKMEWKRGSNSQRQGKRRKRPSSGGRCK